MNAGQSPSTPNNTLKGLSSADLGLFSARLVAWGDIEEKNGRYFSFEYNGLSNKNGMHAWNNPIIQSVLQQMLAGANGLSC